MSINITHFSPEDYLPAERVNNILDSIKNNEDSIKLKADKAKTLEGYNIEDAYNKTEIDGTIQTVYFTIGSKADKANTLAGYGISDAYTKQESDAIHEGQVELVATALETKANKAATLMGYGIEDAYTQIAVDNLLLTKADQSSVNALSVNKQERPHIENTSGYLNDTYIYYFDYMSDVRITDSAKIINLEIPSDAYPEDYVSGLSFNSGETPTSINYTGTGILNWVGTDCTISEGYSIFQPSPNTHYDIVFYFNGMQFVGLVNGFVPAIGNVVGE